MPTSTSTLSVISSTSCSAGMSWRASASVTRSEDVDVLQLDRGEVDVHGSGPVRAAGTRLAAGLVEHELADRRRSARSPRPAG